MLTLLFGLMQFTQPVYAPVVKEQTVYQIQAVVYQGNPEGSKAAGTLNVVSSPKLVTKNGQMAQVQVGQAVPVVTDIKIKNGAIPKDNIITKTLIVEQLGLMMRMTATEQNNGEVFLDTYVQLKELVKAEDGNESVLERAVKSRKLAKLGEKVIVPLYNPNDYVERIKVAGSDEVQTRKKPYTGKEAWVELVVTESKP